MRFCALTLLFGLVSNAAPTPGVREIHCAHPQVCNLAENFLRGLQEDKRPQVTLVHKFQGDFHDYEPSAGELKTATTAPYLVVGPMDLHPWMGKISQRRQAAGMKFRTIALKAERGQEHFWLHPMALESAYRQLAQEMAADWGANNAAELPLQRLKARVEELKARAQGHKLVVGHDALGPLAQELGLKSLPLQAGHHHHEISPRAIKNLHKLLEEEKGPVIWLMDKNAPPPAKLRALVRPQDKFLELNLEGQSGQVPTAVLEELLAQLAKALGT